MKTKIVYVITSLETDVYLEQALVSAWSCKYYNPDCNIVLVCDQDTSFTMDYGKRREHKILFDEIIVKDFDKSQSMMERSRWLKTSLREIIQGDFLFVDSDTIVCMNLSFIDDFSFEVGFVLDENAEISEDISNTAFFERINRLYEFDYSSERYYFNSGIAFSKDTENAHKLFAMWHDLWKTHRYEKDGMKDQGALNVANVKLGHIITEMSGDLNCQVMQSVQYLHTAAIVHFFNCFSVAGKLLNPFYGKEIYLQVKRDGLTEEIQNKVLNCKSEFISPSVIVPLEGASLWRDYCNNKEMHLMKSNSYYFLSYLKSNHSRLFLFIEKLLGKIIVSKKN